VRRGRHWKQLEGRAPDNRLHGLRGSPARSVGLCQPRPGQWLSRLFPQTLRFLAPGESQRACPAAGGFARVSSFRLLCMQADRIPHLIMRLKFLYVVSMSSAKISRAHSSELRLSNDTCRASVTICGLSINCKDLFSVCNHTATHPARADPDRRGCFIYAIAGGLCKACPFLFKRSRAKQDQAKLWTLFLLPPLLLPSRFGWRLPFKGAPTAGTGREEPSRGECCALSCPARMRKTSEDLCPTRLLTVSVRKSIS